LGTECLQYAYMPAAYVYFGCAMLQCTCVNTIQERDGRTPHDSLDYTMRSIVWRKMNFTQCNGAVHQATSLFIVVV